MGLIPIGIFAVVALFWCARLQMRILSLEREIQLERSRLRKHITEGPPHPQYPPDALTYVTRAELNSYLAANLDDHLRIEEWIEAHEAGQPDPRRQ